MIALTRVLTISFTIAMSLHSGGCQPRPVPEPPAPLSRAQLVKLGTCESTMNPTATSPSGKYGGLFQFDARTWNAAARAAGRPDLVGVRPEAAHPLNQILLVQQWWHLHGRSPWPHCERNV